VTTNFTRTRNQLATKILSKITQSGSNSVSSTDAGLVYEAIDLRLKEMQKLGIFWRKVNKTPLSFTITANINSASASADVLFPVAMYVTDNSADVEVEIIGIKEYADIQNKTDSGTPTKVLWNGSAEFIFWPVPIANTTAKLTYEKLIDDTADTTAPDIEVSMMKSLIDIIAYDLGDDFGINESKMRRWEAAAERAERNIRKLGIQRVALTTVVIDSYDSKPDDYATV